MTSGLLRVAAVQMCSTRDWDRNLARARELIGRAASRGAQLVALPENFSFLGRDGEKIDFVEDEETGPALRLLAELAREHHVALVGGSVPLRARAPGKVTNTCIVLDETGRRLARYDKMHLFDVHLDERHEFSESRTVEAGRDAVTFEAFGLRMGLAICYDLRFPELFRALTLAGAVVTFVPSAFTFETGCDHWEVLLRARAIENLAFVVAPAQWGRHDTDRRSFGRTMVVDPWGHVLARCPDREDVLLCDLDLGLVEEARRRLPAIEHLRRGRFYG